YDKPAIAPRLGSIAETLGEADDLLYDPREKSALVAALDRSLKADFDAMGLRVRAACDRLDWDDIGRQTVETYRAALAKPT
ncbi:MAG: group 1 glycosyl transferase, partial [Cyanobacteria bacterium J06639_1]